MYQENVYIFLLYMLLLKKHIKQEVNTMVKYNISELKIYIMVYFTSKNIIITVI